MKIKKLASIIATSICAFSFVISPLIGCDTSSTEKTEIATETEYEIVDASTYNWDSFKSPFEEMDLSYDEPNPNDVKMNLAVISDIHLQTRDDHATRNFERAIDTCVEMADGNLDAVAMVGDLLDNLWWNTVNYSEDGNANDIVSVNNAYRIPEVEHLRNVFDQVIPADTSVMFTLGNHDMCDFTGRYGATTSSDQKIVEELEKVKDGSINRDYFEYLQGDDEGEYIDSQPQSVQRRLGLRYYRQNGVNFIILNADKFYSAVNCYTEGRLNWLKRVLNYIRENHSGEPVLMFTHQPINDSVLGSVNQSHSLTLEPILKEYPEVILFTGHIHRSLYHESAITQKLGFTVVESASVKYTDNSLYTETSAFNVFNGAQSSSSSQGLMVRIMKDNTVRIARVDFTNQRKAGKDWIVKPLDGTGKNAIHTTEYREKNNSAPYFKNAKVAIEYNDNLNPTKDYTDKYLTIKFSPAQDKETLILGYVVKTYDSMGEKREEIVIDSANTAGKPLNMYSLSLKDPQNISKIEIFAEDGYYKRSLPIVIESKDFGNVITTKKLTQTYIGSSSAVGNLTANGVTYCKSEAFVKNGDVINNFKTALGAGNYYFDAFASSYTYSFKISDMVLGSAGTTHGDASSEYRLGVNLATFEQDGYVYSFNGVFDFGTYNSNTRTRTSTNNFYFYATVSAPQVKTFTRQYALAPYGINTVEIPSYVKDKLKSSEGGVVSVTRNGSVFTICFDNEQIASVDLKGDYLFVYNLVSFTEDVKSTFGINIKGAEANFTNFTFTAQ
ncbi:MAG: hypothetical protein E7353_04460 [Clostridiales bacterium]|nr:hypothetical protein [Clostridiales bacterium]